MNYFRKFFNFSSNNWLPVLLLILVVFSIYWFGIRPIMIRKDCATVRWVEPASPAEPASADWPKCQEVNPYDTGSLFSSIKPFNYDCHASRPASPQRNREIKASDNEYKICLRENGI